MVQQSPKKIKHLSTVKLTVQQIHKILPTSVKKLHLCRIDWPWYLWSRSLLSLVWRQIAEWVKNRAKKIYYCSTSHLNQSQISLNYLQIQHLLLDSHILLLGHELRKQNETIRRKCQRKIYKNNETWSNIRFNMVCATYCNKTSANSLSDSLAYPCRFLGLLHWSQTDSLK